MYVDDTVVFAFAKPPQLAKLYQKRCLVYPSGSETII